MECLTQLVTLLYSGALEDKEEKKGDNGEEEEDPEIAEAKREAEEKRNEKYRNLEEERETMRQGIRDKVGTTMADEVSYKGVEVKEKNHS